jgi:hypothetical protein
MRIDSILNRYQGWALPRMLASPPRRFRSWAEPHPVLGGLVLLATFVAARVAWDGLWMVL